MDVRALHNQKDYDWAIKEVSRYFDNQPKRGSADGDRFEVLLAIIKAYEDEHFPVADVDPVEVLHFAIASMGRTQAELARLIGRSHASEVLNRKRALSLQMIRTISAEWKIPIEVLAQPYELAREFA